MTDGTFDTKRRVTVREGVERLPMPEEARYVRLLEHGTLEVELYAPRGTDPQQPHSKDEVYVVVRGTGTYFIDGARLPVGPGDLLFAPAGAVHRFEDFSDDLTVWVIFYGPDGGEAPND